MDPMERDDVADEHAHDYNDDDDSAFIGKDYFWVPQVKNLCY